MSSEDWFVQVVPAVGRARWLLPHGPNTACGWRSFSAASAKALPAPILVAVIAIPQGEQKTKRKNYTRAC